MRFSISKLRENIYQILDQVLKTGRPIQIERKGKLLQIAPVERVSKLSNLEKKEILNVNAEDLVHLDWSDDWNPKIK